MNEIFPVHCVVSSLVAAALLNCGERVKYLSFARVININFNFSIKHQYIVKQTSHEIKENHQLGVPSLCTCTAKFSGLDYRGCASQKKVSILHI